MKISKLFHWLYGILMLLPCFAILVKCAYVTFNKNAFESYYGQTINEENLVQVETITNNENYVFLYSSISNINNNVYFTCTDSTLMLQNETKTINNGFFYYNDGQNRNYLAYRYDNSAYQYTDLASIVRINFNNFYSTGNKLQLLGTFYKIDYNKYSYLDNVFYYAVDEVCNNELFAWASNSFLNAPLTYITNLFNMPTDNAVILLMSYWFNISIIWLCFDVMIYVPLLVHRWLDKGIVE